MSWPCFHEYPHLGLRHRSELGCLKQSSDAWKCDRLGPGTGNVVKRRQRVGLPTPKLGDEREDWGSITRLASQSP